MEINVKLPNAQFLRFREIGQLYPSIATEGSGTEVIGCVSWAVDVRKAHALFSDPRKKGGV